MHELVITQLNWKEKISAITPWVKSINLNLTSSEKTNYKPIWKILRWTPNIEILNINQYYEKSDRESSALNNKLKTECYTNRLRYLCQIKFIENGKLKKLNLCKLQYINYNVNNMEHFKEIMCALDGIKSLKRVNLKFEISTVSVYWSMKPKLNFHNLILENTHKMNEILLLYGCRLEKLRLKNFDKKIQLLKNLNNLEQLTIGTATNDFITNIDWMDIPKCLPNIKYLNAYTTEIIQYIEYLYNNSKLICISLTFKNEIFLIYRNKDVFRYGWDLNGFKYDWLLPYNVIEKSLTSEILRKTNYDDLYDFVIPREFIEHH